MISPGLSGGEKFHGARETSAFLCPGSPQDLVIGFWMKNFGNTAGVPKKKDGRFRPSTLDPVKIASMGISMVLEALHPMGEDSENRGAYGIV